MESSAKFQYIDIPSTKVIRMAACRVLCSHTLRQIKLRSASPFSILSVGNRRGVGFGDCAERSPAISSLAHRKTTSTSSVKNIMLTVEETRRLLRAVSIEGLRTMLQENGKEFVSYRELLDMCKRWSFKESDEEAARTARELEETGVVLNLRGRVYLKPEKVARAISRVMPLGLPSGDDPRIQELKELSKQKGIIDEKARKQVQMELCFGLGFLILQTAGLFRLTFWELSWDVMEPIAFHLASFYMICGHAFFIVTCKDPTYEGWFTTRFKSKQKNLMRKANFDLQRFTHLQNLFKNPTKAVDSTFSTGNSRGLLDLLEERELRQNPSA